MIREPRLLGSIWVDIRPYRSLHFNHQESDKELSRVLFFDWVLFGIPNNGKVGALPVSPPPPLGLVRPFAAIGPKSGGVITRVLPKLPAGRQIPGSWRCPSPTAITPARPPRGESSQAPRRKDPHRKTKAPGDSRLQRPILLLCWLPGALSRRGECSRLAAPPQCRLRQIVYVSTDLTHSREFGHECAAMSVGLNAAASAIPSELGQ